MSMIGEDPANDGGGSIPFSQSDLHRLRVTAERICEDPAQGIIGFRVVSSWVSRLRSRSRITFWSLGGEKKSRDFTIVADEPTELAGTNMGPNPEELLLAALNACLIAGYALEAALCGITLEELDIETEGELDLRGLLGACEDVRPGYESICYVVRVKGSGTKAQFEEMHGKVQSRSPIYFNLTRPTRVAGRIEVVE